MATDPSRPPLRRRLAADRWWRAGWAAAVPLAATLGAVIATAVADALALRSADARFVAVCLGIALPIGIARVARPGSRRATRVSVAILIAPWLAAALAPRSALAVTWLAGGALMLGAEAVGYTAVTAWRLGSTSASRGAFAALATLPGAYLWMAAFVVLFNTQLVVAPVRLAHLSPERTATERELVLETEDGYRVAATYTPATPESTDDGARHDAGVVLVHGVADGRGRFAPWARRLSNAGYHAIRIDLRAHGQSDGAVVTYGQREGADVRAAVDALRDRGVREIAVVGASMGGAVVLAAAPSLVRGEVRALILLAPASRFPPLVARRVGFLGPLAAPVLTGSARLASAMGQIPMTAWVPSAGLDDRLPVLVLHGAADTTIPLALSEALARRHPRVALTRLEGVGHDEIPAESARDPATWRRIRRFLDRHLAP